LAVAIGGVLVTLMASLAAIFLPNVRRLEH